MKPYRSGNYVVGNRFLYDLRTKTVSHHCRHTMQLLASQLPPDGPAAPEDIDPNMIDPFWGCGPVTDADRLETFAPFVEQIIGRLPEELKPEAEPAARPWSDSDEHLYQTAKMWECAVYHWTEGNGG